MIIDAHWHVVPESYLKLLSDGRVHFGQRLEMKEGNPWLIQSDGFAFPVTPGYWNHETRMRDMETMQVDKAVISISPTLFHYERPVEEGIEISRFLNDAVAEIVDTHSEKYIGAGTVPMQDVNAAIEEMERCWQRGFRLLQIGSNVEGINYDYPDFLPFFKACEKKGMTLYMHPYFVAMKSQLKKYYMLNLVGYPLDGTIACISMTLGGVLAQCPELKVIFAHGGGQFLFLLGRIKHGYTVRTETKASCFKAPDLFLSQMYFDTMVYDKSQLKMIAEIVGTDHLLMGSDYNFDMADRNAVNFIKSVGFTPEEERGILGKNILQLLNS